MEAKTVPVIHVWEKTWKTEYVHTMEYAEETVKSVPIVMKMVHPSMNHAPIIPAVKGMGA